MNVQKTFNIDENANYWTIRFNGESKTFCSFVDTCNWAFEAHIHGIKFEIENNFYSRNTLRGVYAGRQPTY